MVKNNIITKFLLITIPPLIGFGIFYTINQSSIINPISNIPSYNKTYSADAGLENVSQIVASAVENYANQDSSESIEKRNQRLSLFFTGDSPVYKYEQKNINPPISRSITEVNSINNIESEGIDLNLLVKTTITLYEGNITSKINKNYLISLTKIYDGTMTPYDIKESEL